MLAKLSATSKVGLFILAILVIVICGRHSFAAEETPPSGENTVCTGAPQSCPSGAIILIKRDFSMSVAKFCDFSKSMLNAGSEALVCMKK
jgi:hypothetical protein